MWHAFLYSNNFTYMNYLILAIQCKVIILKKLKVSKNLSSTFFIVMVLDKKQNRRNTAHDFKDLKSSAGNV